MNYASFYTVRHMLYYAGAWTTGEKCKPLFAMVGDAGFEPATPAV